MKHAKRLPIVVAIAAASTLWTQTARADSVTAKINENLEYSVEWAISDWSTSALVDTGSTFTLLPGGQITQLVSEGLARPYGSIVADTGLGNSRMQLYVVQEFTIGACSVKGPFLVLEAPITALGANMLYAIRPWRFDGNSLMFTCPSR